MRLLGRAGSMKLFGRGGPAGFSGELAADERILAQAVTDDGGPVVATSHGLWFRESAAGTGSIGPGVGGFDFGGPGVGGTDVDEPGLVRAGSGDAGTSGSGPEPAMGGVRRIGWHEINKATWQTGMLTVVVAERIEVVGCLDARSAGAPLGVDVRSGCAPLGVEIIADGPPRRLRLPDPGKVPQTVQARVEGSIRTRARRILPGGGTWVVHRRVVGQDGVLLQVRPDPDTDPAAVRRLAAEVAAEFGGAG